MKNNLIIGVALFFLFFAKNTFVFSQELSLKDSVPFSPAVKKNTLPNGFTYYLSRNTIKPGRVYIKLNVKAGVYQQEKDQTEASHLVEHILFRSSLHFKSFHEYLKATNVEYNGGPDRDFISYHFELPADTAVVESIFLAFQDWLSGQGIFTKETINAEKKIIIEEHLTKGPGRGDAAYQLLRPSRYSEVADAASYNSPHSIMALSPAAIKRFYKDWYRPNLASLIIVGDMDTALTERIMKRMFAGLHNPVEQKPYVNYPVVLTGANKYITDVSATPKDKITSIELFYLKQGLPKVTLGDYKEAALIELFNSMLRNRFNDLYKSRSRQMPGMVYGSFGDIYTMNNLGVKALYFSYHSEKTGSIKASLKTLFTESERIQRYGFTMQELESARSELLADLPQGKGEGLMQEADHYTDHFVYHEAAPDAKLSYQSHENFLKGLTLEEINQTVRSWITAKNRSLVLRVPQSARPYLPDEATALAWFKEIQQGTIAPYQFSPKKEVSVHFDTLYRLPVAGTYTRKDFAGTTITQLQLLNGVTVILKPAVSSAITKENNVTQLQLTNGFSVKQDVSPGSNSRVWLQGIKAVNVAGYADANYFSALYAPGLLLAEGLGELNRNELDSYTKEHSIKFSAEITDQESRVRISAPNKELEVALQLIYRYFLRPRMYSVEFTNAMDQLRDFMKPTSDVFPAELTALAGHRVKLGEQLSSKELNKITYPLCLQGYEASFSNPQDFTFAITGVQDMDKAIALTAKYLGNLPSRKVNVAPLPAIYPKRQQLDITKTIVNKTLQKDRTEVVLLYTGYYPVISGEQSVKEKIKQALLVKIIEKICLRRLRQKEAGIYAPPIIGIVTQKELGKIDQSWYQLIVRFPCESNVRHKLLRAAEQEIELLKTNGPESNDFNTVVENYKKIGKLDKDDSWWREQLKELSRNKEDLSKLPDINAQINAITPADIQQAAKEYLNNNNLIRWMEVGAAKY